MHKFQDKTFLIVCLTGVPKRLFNIFFFYIGENKSTHYALDETT
jgi:hypothetical protein